MIVLGIETSCDETSAAIVTDERKVLAHTLRTQLHTHKEYGGVVPEIAARMHLDILDQLIEEVMKEANISWGELDGVAATGGPGLIGGVIVGTMMGKAIASVHKIPYMAVNHLVGHALTVRLTDNVQYPFLLLLVSGGHCEILVTKGPQDFDELGGTMDDAVGEAFDKTGRLLGIPYPAGPEIEKLAMNGDPKRFKFPRPLLKPVGGQKYEPFTFSLSGLKTAVRRQAESLGEDRTQQDIYDICAAFQEAIGDILCDRIKNALGWCRENSIPITTLVVSGGVASNMYLRKRLSLVAEECAAKMVAPPPKLCVDNAAMIAWAGIEMLQNGIKNNLDFAPRPRWPLVEGGN